MGWGWGSAAFKLIVPKHHPFSCNTSSILVWLDSAKVLLFLYTFSTEGEIAGSAEVASCYVICDTCPTQREKRECTSGKLPCALTYASRLSADTPSVRRLGNARESDYCVQVISSLGKPCKHKYVHFLRTLVAPAHTLVHGRCTQACINCIPA